MIDVRIDKTAHIVHPGLLRLGNHISIDVGVYVSTQLRMGDYIHIAPYACIIGGEDTVLRMKDFTNIAAGAKIIVRGDDFCEGMLNPIVPVEYRKLVGEITIMYRFSAIGANSVVLPNVHMAEGSVLAAGSVLTHSTEPWTIYVGSPARPVKTRNKELILKAARELGYEV
jgi:acetyltransferase-like isoleucine patch superfamily enzyme